VIGLGLVLRSSISESVRFIFWSHPVFQSIGVGMVAGDLPFNMCNCHLNCLLENGGMKAAPSLWRHVCSLDMETHLPTDYISLFLP
jgi:hypothetical protein